MSAWLRVVFGAFALLAALLGITVFALEASDVATVTTGAEDGNPRTTRVWTAQSGNQTWLEAGTPDNPWYHDIQRDPQLTLDRGDGKAPTAYRALPIPGVEAHDRIRALLREKYGWRDWWIGQVFDTSNSVAVRLVPVAEGAGSDVP